MPCLKRNSWPTKTQRLEMSAMKNGFKPGVHEEHGLYIGQWENDVKQGELGLLKFKKNFCNYICLSVFTIYLFINRIYFMICIIIIIIIFVFNKWKYF